VEEASALAGVAPSRLFESLSCESCPIGETFSYRNDLIRPIEKKSGPVTFIGLQHVESHTGRKIGEDHLRAEELTGRKFKFSPGEIVYGYLRPYLNKVWIADCEGICSVDQYVLRPKSDIVETHYLAHFMRSNTFLEQAIELTHNLLLPRLRTALLESIPIPLPSLEEQRRIVAYLDGLQGKVDALKQLQAQTQVELDALLPSVLDKAFKGEL
jgi:type I restriction enzyme, S subunit